MSKQTQSFPAFPAQEISLRDYFIAHAPAEPQPWFMPVMPPAPDLEIFADEYSNWLTEQAKQRYIQWPAAWADEMLVARLVVTLLEARCD